MYFALDMVTNQSDLYNEKYIASSPYRRRVAQEDVSSQELMIRASVDQGLSLSRRSYVGVS